MQNIWPSNLTGSASTWEQRRAKVAQWKAPPLMKLSRSLIGNIATAVGCEFEDETQERHTKDDEMGLNVAGR